MYNIGQCLYILHAELSFQRQRLARRITENKMGFHALDML